MFSLRSKIIAGLAFILAYGCMAVYLALSLPVADLRFDTDGEHLLVSKGQEKYEQVEQFIVERELIAAHSVLMIEEPDVLPSYQQINVLFSQHQRLFDGLMEGQLKVRLSNGETWDAASQPRTLGMLPFLFWVQLICGLLGTVICLLVWIPGERNLATHAFALTGIGYLLASSSASIYSTRALFIAGDMFQWLSAVNHAGAMLFSSAVSVFLWNYPRKIAPLWLSIFLYACFLACVLIDQGQWVTSPVQGFHLWVLVVFLIGLVGAALQWRETRQRPADRSAFRWVLLSIFAGTVFFSAGMILPAILQIAQPSTQAPLLATFLLMYAGMALGVTRYRLFELERWWFSIWSWLLGGLAVLLADLMLASLLSLSGPEVLAISLALVGWCYFPVRQFIWGLIFARTGRGLDEWLAQALPAMLHARQSNSEDGAVLASLEAVFQPLHLELHTPLSAHPTVRENGEALWVPGASDSNGYLLRHADQGARLFTRQDVRQARLVLALDGLVRQSLEARAEGANEERKRIRQDIHDDLGAKLLQLLHTSPDNSRSLVREAIRDLRELLQNMDGQPVLVESAVAHWRNETEQRCEAAGVLLEWVDQVAGHALEATQFSHLTRLLREAVSNVLKHAKASRLSVHLHLDHGMLHLDVENDGLVDKPVHSRGRGMAIMASRAQELRGNFSQDQQGDCWRITVRIPLSPDQ
ncbi:hypothetical protein [uncultured Halopseudomonas sp.]|uniref:sensor histidine kinase n=1 Tax=uncultured Halopseudomonas sp. TaxID=2901193 RepID=UPI0030ED3F09|tara:strand:- start:6555 stop:8648 length:2094 start_codon:yes stop_codon:yes gene_type:complete